jgi:formate--tetrahydrofolate ligase
MATSLGLKLADVVVTEAGFGADLGAEKFLDIKCRVAGLAPQCVVVVASLRALKMHGGVAKADLRIEDAAAVARGTVNLARHVENMQGYGVPVVVALNHFVGDTAVEFAAVQEAMAKLGVTAVRCTHWGDGASGARDLATAVKAAIAGNDSVMTPLYPDAMPLAEKLRTVAQRIYRARDIELAAGVAKRLAKFEAAGYGHLPVCIAKTQYSFSADPALLGAPVDHTLPVRDVRLSAGAGFVVAVCGDIMTMPGLPRVPSAEAIHIDHDGLIQGLF